MLQTEMAIQKQKLQITALLFKNTNINVLRIKHNTFTFKRSNFSGFLLMGKLLPGVAGNKNQTHYTK